MKIPASVRDKMGVALAMGMLCQIGVQAKANEQKAANSSGTSNAKATAAANHGARIAEDRFRSLDQALKRAKKHDPRDPRWDSLKRSLTKHRQDDLPQSPGSGVEIYSQPDKRGKKSEASLKTKPTVSATSPSTPFPASKPHDCVECGRG